VRAYARLRFAPVVDDVAVIVLDVLVGELSRRRRIADLERAGLTAVEKFNFPSRTDEGAEREAHGTAAGQVERVVDLAEYHAALAGGDPFARGVADIDAKFHLLRRRGRRNRGDPDHEQRAPHHRGQLADGTHSPPRG